MSAGKMAVYRGCTPVLDAQYRDEGRKTPAEAIIDAVSEAAEIDPLELPPLYEFVDPDSLNKLFENENATEGNEIVLGFKIDKWNVFIRNDGRIRVCDSTKPIEPTPVF